MWHPVVLEGRRRGIFKEQAFIPMAHNLSRDAIEHQRSRIRMRSSQSKAVAKATGVLLALLLAIPAVSTAQEANTAGVHVAPGDRIRIVSSQAGDRPAVAVFGGTRADSLFAIRTPGGPFTLALSDVEQLEVSRINRGRGALYGAAIGSIAGTLAWMPVWCREGSDTGEITARDCLGMSLIYGVPSGALVGAVIGGLIGVKTWRPASLPGTLRIGGSPRSASLHLSVPLP
jgi:hypothetical protein